MILLLKIDLEMVPGTATALQNKKWCQAPFSPLSSHSPKQNGAWHHMQEKNHHRITRIGTNEDE